MSQTIEILELLLDGNPHRVDEILRKVYGIEKPSIARVASRVHDIRKHGFEVKSWRDPENKKLWWYQLSPAPRVDSRQETLTAPCGPVDPPSPGRGFIQDELFHVLDERIL